MCMLFVPFPVGLSLLTKPAKLPLNSMPRIHSGQPNAERYWKNHKTSVLIANERHFWAVFRPPRFAASRSASFRPRTIWSRSPAPLLESSQNWVRFSGFGSNAHRSTRTSCQSSVGLSGMTVNGFASGCPDHSLSSLRSGASRQLVPCQVARTRSPFANQAVNARAPVARRVVVPRVTSTKYTVPSRY